MNSKCRYEILLPSQISPSDLNLSVASTNLIRCSTELIQFLNIDSNTGVVTLNSTLNRQKCRDYLFFIKAIDVYQERLSSMLNFKIRVMNNLPKFHHRKYVFNFTKDTSTSNTIKKIDLTKYIRIERVSEPSNGVEFRLDSFSNQTHFSIDKNNNLIVEKKLNYESQKKYRLNLILSQMGKDVDMTVIEINVIDQNEHSPKVIAVVRANKFSNVSRISDDLTYMLTANLSSIMLPVNESSNFYLDLIRIEAIDVDTNTSEIDYSIETVQYFELETNMPVQDRDG